MTGSDLALLARTAVHLRPSQIAQRARLRAQHQTLHCLQMRPGEPTFALEGAT